jgi:phage gpG-like protein
VKKKIGKSFEEVKSGLVQVIRSIPTVAGTEAVNHFKASFRNQGFTDSGLTKWPKRKRDTDPGRAVLTKTGRTKRAIRKQQQTETTVLVGINRAEVPYAEYHNKGGILSVRGHKRRKKSGRRSDREGNYQQVRPHFRKLPKRQFIGNSQTLDKRIADKIVKLLKSITQ